MKVRLKSARADTVRSWRVGQVADLPENTARKLLAIGEAEEYVEGEPEYLPPQGADPAMVVMSASSSSISPGANKSYVDRPPQPQPAPSPQRKQTAVAR